jgi:hypothetical protein
VNWFSHFPLTKCEYWFTLKYRLVTGGEMG